MSNFGTVKVTWSSSVTLWFFKVFFNLLLRSLSFLTLWRWIHNNSLYKGGLINVQTFLGDSLNPLLLPLSILSSALFQALPKFSRLKTEVFPADSDSFISREFILRLIFINSTLKAKIVEFSRNLTSIWKKTKKCWQFRSVLHVSAAVSRLPPKLVESCFCLAGRGFTQKQGRGEDNKFLDK